MTYALHPTYTPPNPYPYAIENTDHEWRAWWQCETYGVTRRDFACGYSFGNWVCTLPKGHDCRHVGHLSSGEVCGLGPETIPPELRVSEGL